MPTVRGAGLDNKNLAAIGSLMVAVAGGMHAVDCWIVVMEKRLGLDVA